MASRSVHPEVAIYLCDGKGFDSFRFSGLHMDMGCLISIRPWLYQNCPMGLNISECARPVKGRPTFPDVLHHSNISQFSVINNHSSCAPFFRSQTLRTTPCTLQNMRSIHFFEAIVIRGCVGACGSRESQIESGCSSEYIQLSSLL
jgi:hypothetical protein